jgi:hypothetical protein
MTPDAVAINRALKFVLLDNDTIVAFDKMFDEFGDETDDGLIATSAIFPLPDGRWCAINLSAFTPTMMS